MFYLRDIRKSRNLTMKELGDKVGVTESAIGLYETEKRKPDYEMLLKLSEALECTVNDLVYNPDDIGVPTYDGPRSSAEEDFGDIEFLKSPKSKKLLQVLKGATDEDIDKFIKMIEVMRGE